MAGKLRCLVPFCRRWTRKFPESEEMICGRHWRLADRRLRLAHTKWERTRPYEPSPFWERIRAQVIVRASMEPAR